MAQKGLMKPMNCSSDLSAVIGKKKCSRAETMKLLWAYIKKNKLQDEDDKRTIIPDSKLGRVLGSRPINMLKIAGKISDHLSE